MGDQKEKLLKVREYEKTRQSAVKDGLVMNEFEPLVGKWLQTRNPTLVPNGASPLAQLHILGKVNEEKIFE